MPVSEARSSLSEVLARVDREEITITRHGRSVAVIVRPDALRTRHARTALADAERVHELLETAGAAALPGSTGVSTERAEELIREIRAGRETR